VRRCADFPIQSSWGIVNLDSKDVKDGFVSISISEMGVRVEGSSHCPLGPHRGLLTLKLSPLLYKQCITVLGMLPLALQSGLARETSALNSLNPWMKSS
jgi:hypothetical protein